MNTGLTAHDVARFWRDYGHTAQLCYNLYTGDRVWILTVQRPEEVYRFERPATAEEANSGRYERKAEFA